MSEQPGIAPTDATMPAHAIAVVGMAGRFPGASDLEDFWRQIAEGVEVLEELSDADLDAAGVSAEERSRPGYVRRGTFLEHCEEFDAGFFGYPPREAQVLDPQHRVFLECAAEALEHAGYAAGTSGLPESVGVYAGASMNTYVFGQIMRNPALAEAVGGYQLMLANEKDYLCTRVSYKLGLKGPSMTVQTACSTSLVAVQVACRALQRGECDMALAGGVSILFPQRAGYLFQEGMILSPDGHCRPFDVAAQGTRSGAGAGVVVLKRLDQALADGDTVHAVIRGIAVNNDGAEKAGFTAPSVEGQVEVIATAQALAGVPARSVTYVEAHGTATLLGDPIEIEALTQVFRSDTSDVGFCHLGSLKANLGHLDAAAGVAGLIKTVLALTHRELPPLTNFSKANPALRLDASPFRADPTRSVWQPPAGGPRRAGVSSFGIGDTNAHAVLEEAPTAVPRAPSSSSHLFVWSARSAPALDASGLRLAAHLSAHPEQDLADVAYTLQVGRQAFVHRRAVVASNRAQAIAALADPLGGGVIGARHEGGTRPVAFLFSGQGSQHAGMGRGLYETLPVYREAVDRCAALLRPHLDADIRELMFADAGTSLLSETRVTQPALFITGYALAMCWQAFGLRPAAMLGHSIGEYVAAHLAGVMSLPDALEVVATRGRLMQQQAPGRMAAVHLGANEVKRWLQPGLEIAAVNAPALCTLSGPAEAVGAVVERLAREGIDARVLQTSHAYHSSMMSPALAPFTAMMERIRLAPPALPYISNVSGTWITAEQATSPAYWADHLRRPVQFEGGMRALTASEPAMQFLELGPGQTLAALARTNLGGSAPDAAARVVASMRRPADARPDREVLLEAAARLWLAGCAIDWRGSPDNPPGADRARRRVPLPTYPYERQRFAVDPAPSATTAGATVPGSKATGGDDSVSRSASVNDWFYAPTWSRDDAVPTRPTESTSGATPRWLVLGNEDRLTSAVMEELARRGHEVLRADAGSRFETRGTSHWCVRADSADDLCRLLGEACRAPLAGIVHLWGLTGSGSDAGTVAGQRAATVSPVALHEPAYDGLVALACALPDLSPTLPLHLLHATKGIESVLGEPARQVTQALATGPVLVLPREIPGLRMRAVDLEADDLDTSEGILRVATVLADETGHEAVEPQVAHRAGLRWVRRYERLSLPARPPTEATPLRRGGCYLITGGLGGIGLAIAHWLGTGLGARLVLTSRQGLPPRDTWDEWIDSHDAADPRRAAMAAIRAIEAAGGEVLVASADAADDMAMGRALAEARTRFGELHGVFHAAGIPGRGSIARRSNAAEARAVFAPKLGGLQVLCRLLGQQHLDLVVLVGSINAALPAPGVCDYSAANAVLDAFVDSAARPAAWQRVVAIDWGAWREVGMAARLSVPENLRAHWATHLAGAIAPDDGIDALARVLASKRRRVIVETYDVVRTHELMRHRAALTGASDPRLPAPAAGPEASSESARVSPSEPPAGASARPALSTPYVEPSSEVERRLAVIWEDLLGVRGIGVDDDFFELGGHSLMFTRVLALIDEGFGTRLPLREVFDTSTIRLLAKRLPGQASAADTRAAGKRPQDEHPREVLEI